MRLLLILLISALCSSQTITTICGDSVTTCGGSSTIRARGFQWTLVADTVNGGFLWPGGTVANLGIYSNAIWHYNVDTNTWTKKVDNNSTVAGPGPCAQNGAPYDTYEPLLGHPQGYAFAHGNIYHTTLQLCGGHNYGYTNRYDMTSQAMIARLTVSPFGCSNTFNCSANTWGTITYVAGQSKAYYCCSSSASRRIEEFSGSTYTDITASIEGSDSLACSTSAHCPPAVLNGAVVMSDGIDLWVYGGCNGSTPGNGSGSNQCNGTKQNDIYRLDLADLEWTKYSPSGTKPELLNSSFSIIAYDSSRARFIIYDATNSWRVYTPGTNAWTTLTVSGSGPAIDAARQNGVVLGYAIYDAASDTMVIITGRSQDYAPEVYELALATVTGVGLGGNLSFGGGVAIK